MRNICDAWYCKYTENLVHQERNQQGNSRSRRKINDHAPLRGDQCADCKKRHHADCGDKPQRGNEPTQAKWYGPNEVNETALGRPRRNNHHSEEQKGHD